MKQSKKNKQPTNVDIAAADERASAADTDAAEKKTKWFRRPLVRKLGYLFKSEIILHNIVTKQINEKFVLLQ